MVMRKRLSVTLYIHRMFGNVLKEDNKITKPSTQVRTQNFSLRAGGGG
jgi:hypothetical protein